MPVIISVDDSTLQRRLGKTKKITVDAKNVLDAIKQADTLHPGFGSDILSNNKLRDSLDILLNGENISFLKGLNTPTPNHSEIHILRQMLGC